MLRPMEKESVCEKGRKRKEGRERERKKKVR